MKSPMERQQAAKVVVATTVALSFISFWRAAAIVLSDLASSAFYAGGIAEKAIGASAPWFILGVMLFSFAVRSVYIESSSTFVRGGVHEKKTAHTWIFTSGELRSMFEASGLEVESMLASPSGEPFRLGSPRLILTARKSA